MAVGRNFLTLDWVLNPNLWLMRPELNHNASLASATEECESLCTTKHVQSFAIWQWAVNSANLEKKVDLLVKIWISLISSVHVSISSAY